MTYTALPDMPLITVGDDLALLIAASLRRAGLRPASGDVIVIAQKIISKAEGRYLDLATITPSTQALELAGRTGKDAHYVEAVLSETAEVMRVRPDTLIVTHRLGFVMANAGIDESNIAQTDGQRRVLLLPEDPDGSCAALKAKLDAEFSVDLAVVINDSFGRAWRMGVVGTALGAAGLPSLRSLVGVPDLFGRAMRVTEVAVADELAAAASLLMGQADEGRPVIHVRGFVAEGSHRPAADLIRAKSRDLFR